MSLFLSGYICTTCLMKLIGLVAFEYSNFADDYQSKDIQQLESTKTYCQLLGRISANIYFRHTLALMANLDLLPNFFSLDSTDRMNKFQEFHEAMNNTGPARSQSVVTEENLIPHLKGEALHYRGIHQAGPVFNPEEILSGKKRDWENHKIELPIETIPENVRNHENVKDILALDDAGHYNKTASFIIQQKKTKHLLFNENIGVGKTLIEKKLMDNSQLTIERKIPIPIAEIALEAIASDDPVQRLIAERASARKNNTNRKRQKKKQLKTRKTKHNQKPKYVRKDLLSILKTSKGRKIGKKRGVREDFKLGKIKHLEHKVLTIQMEIAQALQIGDYNLAKKLQMKLCRNPEAMAFAVYRFLRNSGSKTPGIKDNIPMTNKDYKAIVSKMWAAIKQPKTYKATPLRRIEIPKPSGGYRPISIPTTMDRCLQTLIHFSLLPFAEHLADRFSFGFRPYRSPHGAIRLVKTLMTKGHRKNPALWIVNLDIRKCFDQINHSWILENVSVPYKQLLIQWLSCGFIMFTSGEEYWEATTEGVPQGGVISPTICNITLNGIQAKVETAIKQELGESSHLIRYADDCLIMCHSEAAAKLAIKVAQDFLTPRGLEINTEKTKISHIYYKDRSFNFLGYQFRYLKKRGIWKAYASIPSEAVSSIKTRILARMIRAKSLKPLFCSVNSLVAGFYYYYSAITLRTPIESFDSWLMIKFGKALYQLYINPNFERGRFGLRKGKRGGKLRRKKAYRAVRRMHYLLNKHRKTYKFPKAKRYSNWVLSKTKDGRKIELFRPVEQPRLLTLYITNKNAFIPDERKALIEKAISGKPSIRKRLLKQQKGLCKLCELDIIEFNSQIHHIKPIDLGGNWRIKNLALLCTNCHRKVTTAVSSKNTELIQKYAKLGLLKLLQLKIK
eukprot:TRINITY_DN144_c22_g1_i1.p1 TRINITY_DN144_c22_g1~~TRINITY_DN144_c22_g1_i1.p1  ORF type:complete len:949 (-),score=4.08 TRINITY_DN144_c22_g1_i1:107-2815(-)